MTFVNRIQEAGQHARNKYKQLTPKQKKVGKGMLFLMIFVFGMILAIPSQTIQEQIKYKKTAETKWEDMNAKVLGMDPLEQKIFSIVCLTFMVSMLFTLLVYNQCIFKGCNTTSTHIIMGAIVLFGITVIWINAAVINRFNTKLWVAPIASTDEERSKQALTALVVISYLGVFALGVMVVILLQRMLSN